jgi:hypothetical protein
LCVGPNGGEACFAQDLEVLVHGGLGDPELAVHHVHERARGLFAADE